MLVNTMSGEILKEHKYKNWVCGAKGLEFLKDGLKDFVGNKVSMLRDHQLHIVGFSGSVRQCNICTSQNLLPDHANVKKACNNTTCIERSSRNCFGSKPRKRRKCPNGLCSKLYDAIVTDHLYNSPSWKGTDPTTWCSDEWMFAKCYQTTPTPATSAQDTDVVSLLSILINCRFMHSFLACNQMGSKTLCIFQKARDICNEILHRAKFELDDQTLDTYLDIFIAVLQDPKQLATHYGSHDAVLKLIQLKSGNRTQETLKEVEDTVRSGLTTLKRKEIEVMQETEDAKANIMEELIYKRQKRERATQPLVDSSPCISDDDELPGQSGRTLSAGLIPAEILKMDTNSIELYKRALREGKVSVHNIRVMIVGHFGVGKTTLTKRLFGEDVDISKRESTNGIDVHVRRCRVSLDTGQWKIIDKEKKQKTANHQLIKLLKTSNLDNINSEKEEIKRDTTHDEDEIADGSMVSIDNDAIQNDPENHANETEIADNYLDDSSADTTGNMTDSTTVNPEIPREEHIANHLKELIEEIQQHPMDDEDSATADLSVWDFAGQFAFYATHQTFLSRRAVYLLVTDISKQVQDIVEDDYCFIDGRGANALKIGEFVDFWLNSIHEFCSSPEDDGPPVILIGTFADKLNPETIADTVDGFFYNLRSSLLNKVTFCHLTDEDFAMDNSVVDSNVEKLKKTILDTVSKQKYWGESIPAKWITLENIFDTLRDGSLKVLSKDKLRDLNSNLPVPIETEDELELFLEFHHDCGNILYFSDEKLHDSIILDPQWLIDAFKSLITAKMFCCRKSQKVLRKWVDFDLSAILTQELVDIIWDKEKEENVAFYEYKELLLDYCEKLGFVAKPLLQQNTKETADYYFAPCVLKMSPPERFLENNDDEHRHSSSKLCFRTSSSFLPTAVFNTLLAACISKWPLSKRNGTPAIFCGCGIFDLQDNHSVYIYFSNHEIQIWLTRLSTTGQEPDRDICLEVKVFVSDLLQNRILMSSNIEEYVKCPTAAFHSSENAFAIDELAHKTEVVCCCREEHVLQAEDLTKYWHMKLLPNSFSDCSIELTEKDLGRIANAIGHGWELLGCELGLTPAQIDRISEDNRSSLTKIYSMLTQWRRQNPLEATVGRLYIAMKNCSKVTFEWKAIDRVLSKVERNWYHSSLGQV